MADYKGIKGFKVQYLSADPSDPNIGQTWYNDTSKDLKFTGATAAGAWASGGNKADQSNSAAGAGTQTAALSFGGNPPVGFPGTGATEEYNGTSWSPGGSLNTARTYLGGCGTQTAGLAFGGFAPGASGATEEYDGSTWTTSPGSLNTARYNTGSAGTQTAGLAFSGGSPAAPTAPELTEEYNGTSWTVGNTLVSTRGLVAGCGIQTAALAAGGQTTVAVANTEEYDGTSWTSSPATMGTARYRHDAFGIQTSAIVFGGYTPPPQQVLVEEFNGTSWTSTTNLPSGISYGAGAGTNPAGLAWGAYGSSASYEWTGAGVALTKTITVS